MNHPLNLHAVPATRPSWCRPLPLLATSAPISDFPPLCFQSLAHSSAIRWGWGLPLAAATQTMSSRAKRGICFSSASCTSSTSSTSSTSFTSPYLTPLESALPSQHRVSPGFNRNRPPATSLEAILTRTLPRNSFSSNTYKKTGGGAPTIVRPLTSDLQPPRPVPLPPPPRGATMAGNRETSPLSRCLTFIERTSGAAAATRRIDRKSCLAVQGGPG